jgi:hypothetical protein
VSGNQLFRRKEADWHLTEIFLGETINKSGASHDRVNLAVGVEAHRAAAERCTKEICR